MISTIPVPKPSLEVSFDWDQRDEPFIYVAGTSVYLPENATYTLTGVGIVFTASVVIPDTLPDVEVISYLWDFGDGAKGYGNPIDHTYKVANLQAVCKLIVVDSHNRRYLARAQLYLTTPPALVAIPALTEVG